MKAKKKPIEIKSAEELGVDVRRIGIGGESAGGGLAAALAIKARMQANMLCAFKHSRTRC